MLVVGSMTLIQCRDIVIDPTWECWLTLN